MKAIICSFVFVAAITLSGCSKNNTVVVPKENYPFAFKGLLKKLEVSSWQYGTHIITDEGNKYALKSSTVNLDNFVDKVVTIKGSKIAGYPVDNGPDFIEVKAVE
ncbi:hypothetical protein EXU57_04100 [Segetibacter sp. 3557_3]|uniref:hypothetical protein n=1 Tax=Segetibacter sp. 3557_3 TaxID=2547429 RepID=UPI001058516A|nr:hypothetical protein [Segetibacter sp. 3557_3]TDH29256.1 hypothetical protein EXU57_04100 [Segetibacter sp. 3557_3]